jgi:hypothetical protein
MPVNLIDIQKRIAGYAAQAGEHHRVVADRQNEAGELVVAFANRLDELRARFSRVAEVVPRLRCAVPLYEPLDSAIPMPAPPERYTLLSADGSQINPSRHTRVPFCVINVSVVRMVCGSGEAPRISTSSHFLDYQDLFPSGGGMVSEGTVAMMRDLEERQALIEGADEVEQPAIAMIDGPLELIRDPQDSGGFGKFLDRYLQSLTQSAEKKLAILGYIDKSQSDLVCRLLELTTLSDADLEHYHQTPRRFLGVKDISVLSELLANPGDRSAIFGIHSQTAQYFQGDLALYFFYLNVGLPGKPHLARVEIPAWVARDRTLVGILQAALTAQSGILGTRPYPYLLHRAHEEAIIPISEHQHVEEMIVAEMERRGIPVEEGSFKQYHKDLPTGKTRYQG